MDNPNYLNYIATIPCLICGRPSAQVHHQNERWHGAKALKASDHRTVPLCMDHHTGDGTELQPGSYHKEGWAFWEKYGIDVEFMIVNFNTAYFFNHSVWYTKQ